MIGEAGLSEGVLAELEQTLDHHELIKIKVRVGDRSERDRLIHSLCETGGAELVQRIGNTALLFRHNPEQNRIPLPKRQHRE